MLAKLWDESLKPARTHHPLVACAPKRVTGVERKAYSFLAVRVDRLR